MQPVVDLHATKVGKKPLCHQSAPAAVGFGADETGNFGTKPEIGFAFGGG